ERQLRVVGPGDTGELCDSGDGGAHSPGTRPAELREVVTVLLETGLPVPAEVARVDRVARRDEILGDLLVARRILAHPVHDLDDALRAARPPDVVVDGDALGIDERMVAA